MTQKKVSIPMKGLTRTMTPDDWVSAPAEERPVEASPEPGQTSVEKMKRLTLDIPESLHRAIKRRAVEEGETMVALLRDLLEREYHPS